MFCQRLNFLSAHCKTWMHIPANTLNRVCITCVYSLNSNARPAGVHYNHRPSVRPWSVSEYAHMVYVFFYQIMHYSAGNYQLLSTHFFWHLILINLRSPRVVHITVSWFNLEIRFFGWYKRKIHNMSNFVHLYVKQIWRSWPIIL